jgi:signal transduction histidine kinase
MKLFRHNTFERKLFGWLLSLALVPTLTMLVAAVWIWSGSLNWVGTLGAWDQLADSGRALFEAAEPYGVEHPPLAQAVARHRRDLSESVTMARRWTYLGQRLTAQLPVFVLGLSAGLGALALLLSRRLARELAQPLENLVDWAQRLGREEPLPPPGKLDAAGTVEVQALRRALRQASRDLELARRRALEMERLRVWGEMARRVAHEMKNPLTPLRLAAHRLARDGAAAEPLAVIQEEAGRRSSRRWAGR